VTKCVATKVSEKPKFDILIQNDFTFSFCKNIDACLVSKTFSLYEH
jgi:hypothetical protein